MTRLRRLRLLSGLRTGSSCRNCRRTCRRRPRCTRREREGRGTRGRLAGVGRRGRGGDIVECMHGDFLYGIIASQPAAVTARVLFPCRYLAASLERRSDSNRLPSPRHVPPRQAPSRLARQSPRVPPAPLTLPLQSCNFNQDYSCIAVGHKKGYTILNCDPFGKVHSNSTSSVSRGAGNGQADGCTR